MSSLKKTLMKQGMKLMSDPRVMKLMQDERVMKAVMQVMSMPGKVQSFTQDNVEKLAKAMALATEDEVKDLKRTVRRLEEEVSRMQRDRSGSAGGDNKPSAGGSPSKRSSARE
jgi:cell division FtsZ-interacting protein ZapD